MSDDSLPSHIANSIPATDEFRTMTSSYNPQYIVVHGRRLLGRNEVIVVDRDSREVVERYGTGVIGRITEVFK